MKHKFSLSKVWLALQQNTKEEEDPQDLKIFKHSSFMVNKAWILLNNLKVIKPFFDNMVGRESSCQVIAAI